MFLRDVSSSSKDNRNCRTMNTRDGKEKLKVIHVGNSRFKVAVHYHTYRLVDTSPKYYETVSENVVKM